MALVVGLTPTNSKRYDELAQVSSSEVYAIGDRVEPRRVPDATHKGYYAAQKNSSCAVPATRT